MISFYNTILTDIKGLIFNLIHWDSYTGFETHLSIIYFTRGFKRSIISYIIGNMP